MKPHQADQSKNPKLVNMVSGDEVRDSRSQVNRGMSDRSNNHNRGCRDNPNRRPKTPYYYIHGKDKGHWTNECPIIKEKKEESNRSNAHQSKPVNYTTHNSSRWACPYTVAALATSPLNFSIPPTLPIIPSFPLQPYPSIHTPSLTSPFGTPNPTKPPFGAATCVAATNHNTNH